MSNKPTLARVSALTPDQAYAVLNAYAANDCKGLVSLLDKMEARARQAGVYDYTYEDHSDQMEYNYVVKCGNSDVLLGIFENGDLAELFADAYNLKQKEE